MSIGGGSNKQKSSSSSTSSSYGSDVWGAQSPYLQDLYNRSSFATGQGDYGAAGYMFNAANAAGNATGALDRSQAALGQFAGEGQDPALAAYANNLSQQFNEQFLPGLKGDAALAGGLGGSRQQIGAALGAQRAMQTLGDFTAQTYSGQRDRALQAALGMSANAQGYQTNSQLQTGLADFARSMPWYSLNQYAGLLGNPVLRDLGGYSTGTGSGSGSGWNANAGLS